MPQNRSSQPPEVMTWTKAAPAIAIAMIFDLLRAFFEFFWLFGPAFAAAYCVAKVGDLAVIGGLLSAGCVAGAGAIGFFTSPELEAFGVVMAMAVGFAGWLIIGGWLMVTNARIFKDNALWFVGSLMVSEMPFLGALPALTTTVWRLYHVQIRDEEAALQKWEAAHAAQIERERQQQAAALMQMRQAQEQEAANDAAYDEIQEADEAQYTQEMKEVA